MNTVGSTITVLMPETIHDFAADVTGTKLGTARYVTCELVERRKTIVSGEVRLEYHKLTTTARVFVLSPTASDIAAGAIGIATMTSEGYWELTAVMC